MLAVAGGELIMGTVSIGLHLVSVDRSGMGGVLSIRVHRRACTYSFVNIHDDRIEPLLRGCGL